MKTKRQPLAERMRRGKVGRRAHVIASGAKQSSLSAGRPSVVRGKLGRSLNGGASLVCIGGAAPWDCFAPLAMTALSFVDST